MYRYYLKLPSSTPPPHPSQPSQPKRQLQQHRKLQGPKQTDIRGYFPSKPSPLPHLPLQCMHTTTDTQSDPNTEKRAMDWECTDDMSLTIQDTCNDIWAVTLHYRQTWHHPSTPTSSPTTDSSPLLQRPSKNKPSPCVISPIPQHVGRYPTYLQTHTLTPPNLYPFKFYHTYHSITVDKSLFYWMSLISHKSG